MQEAAKNVKYEERNSERRERCRSINSNNGTNDTDARTPKGNGGNEHPNSTPVVSARKMSVRLA